MNTHTIWRGFPLLALAVGLTACGNETVGEKQEATTAYTCKSIRGDIIRVAKDNDLQLVQIYEPKTILTEPDKVSCSGRALASDKSEATLYYRSYLDQEGARLFEYNFQPLELTP